MARILIAEDDPVTQELYKRILLINAHVPTCVASGEELIKKIDEANPDIVILDVGLPGASGIEVCQSIRQRTGFENLPIMMVSVKDAETDITAGIRAGANDYLLKPIRKSELLAKVELLLEHRGAFSADPTVGTTFAGRYRLIRTLGAGGNSDVHLAIDNQTQREVALKIFKTTEKEENFLPRFLREAYGLSRLSHPNIVKLLDFGNQRNVFYLATEFVKGKSLGEIIKDSVLIEESAVMIALEIGKAFTYMNQFGVVHRDIKPDNILISDASDVVLVDFGLAREEHQQTLSLKDEMFGTPQFLSPEYINGDKKIDIRTDIYSLGITLFYAVSGQLPFVGRTAMAILHQQLNDHPPLLKNLNPEISQEFSHIVFRMMAKDPDDRCGLTDMIAAFEALAGHGESTPPPSPESSSPATPDSPATASPSPSAEAAVATPAPPPPPSSPANTEPTSSPPIETAAASPTPEPAAAEPTASPPVETPSPALPVPEPIPALSVAPAAPPPSAATHSSPSIITAKVMPPRPPTPQPPATASADGVLTAKIVSMPKQPEITVTQKLPPRSKVRNPDQ